MSTRQLLLDSMQEFTKNGPEVSEAGVSAFNKLRRGVTQASHGSTGSPEELLGDLEPKDVVLSFLSNLYEKKKMHRKQVLAVFVELLQVYSWFSACISDAAFSESLLDEMSKALEEAKAKPPMMVGSAPEEPTLGSAKEAATTLKESVDATTLVAAPAADHLVEADTSKVNGHASATAIRQAVDAAREDLETKEVANSLVARLPSGEQTLQLLDMACQKMESIEYSASDRDAASEAFESFRKAVMRVVSSPTKEDDKILCEREPKDRILAFLLDVHSNHSRLTSQVKSIFKRLWEGEFDEWRAAIANDASVHAVVQELVEDERSAPLNPSAHTMVQELVEEESSAPLNPSAHTMVQELVEDQSSALAFSPETEASTWARHSGLPHDEGTDLDIDKKGAANVEAMRNACMSHPKCVGFAYWPEKGLWFPKQTSIGFDPTTAMYRQWRSGEIWEWHYILDRAHPRPTWTCHPDRDLGGYDVAQMPATDIEAVKVFVQENDYSGFSILKNIAYIKKFDRILKLADLHIPRWGKTVSFYIYHPLEMMNVDVLPTDKITWMWGDTNPLTKNLSRMNSLRWSSEKDPMATIEDLVQSLQRGRQEEQGAERPVDVKLLRDGLLRSSKLFSTIAAAIIALRPKATNPHGDEA